MSLLGEHIKPLGRCEEEAAYIELDKEKEKAYMEEHKHRFEEIINSVPKLPRPVRILDIGTTPFTLFLKEAYPHYEIFTLDRTGLMKNRCEAKGIGFWICDLDNHTIPVEDASFDVVICTEVLEHVFAPPTGVLSEIRRIMRDGGKLILSVPNIATLRKRIQLLFGRTPLEDPDEQMKKTWIHGHGHIHEYTMEEIVSLLQRCNFRIGRRRFLRPGISISFRGPGDKWIFDLVRAGHRALMCLVPQFGPTLYVECYK